MTSGPFLAVSTPAVAGAFWLLLITTQILEDHSFVANGYFFQRTESVISLELGHTNTEKRDLIAKASVCLKLRKRFRTTAVSPVFQ